MKVLFRIQESNRTKIIRVPPTALTSPDVPTVLDNIFRLLDPTCEEFSSETHRLGLMDGDEQYAGPVENPASQVVNGAKLMVMSKNFTRRARETMQEKKLQASLPQKLKRLEEAVHRNRGDGGDDAREVEENGEPEVEQDEEEYRGPLYHHHTYEVVSAVLVADATRDVHLALPIIAVGTIVKGLANFYPDVYDAELTEWVHDVSDTRRKRGIALHRVCKGKGCVLSQGMKDDVAYACKIIVDLFVSQQEERVRGRRGERLAVRKIPAHALFKQMNEYQYTTPLFSTVIGRKAVLLWLTSKGILESSNAKWDHILKRNRAEEYGKLKEASDTRHFQLSLPLEDARTMTADELLAYDARHDYNEGHGANLMITGDPDALVFGEDDEVYYVKPRGDGQQLKSGVEVDPDEYRGRDRTSRERREEQEAHQLPAKLDYRPPPLPLDAYGQHPHMDFQQQQEQQTAQPAMVGQRHNDVQDATTTAPGILPEGGILEHSAAVAAEHRHNNPPPLLPDPPAELLAEKLPFLVPSWDSHEHADEEDTEVRTHMPYSTPAPSTVRMSGRKDLADMEAYEEDDEVDDHMHPHHQQQQPDIIETGHDDHHVAPADVEEGGDDTLHRGEGGGIAEGDSEVLQTGLGNDAVVVGEQHPMLPPFDYFS